MFCKETDLCLSHNLSLIHVNIPGLREKKNWNDGPFAVKIQIILPQGKYEKSGCIQNAWLIYKPEQGNPGPFSYVSQI